jgi:hypothetical protein
MGKLSKKLSNCGAGDGTRTRDNLLGRQGLYQLSYSRRIVPILAVNLGHCQKARCFSILTAEALLLSGLQFLSRHRGYNLDEGLYHLGVKLSSGTAFQLVKGLL